MLQKEPEDCPPTLLFSTTASFLIHFANRYQRNVILTASNDIIYVPLSPTVIPSAVPALFAAICFAAIILTNAIYEVVKNQFPIVSAETGTNIVHNPPHISYPSSGLRR